MAKTKTTSADSSEDTTTPGAEPPPPPEAPAAVETVPSEPPPWTPSAEHVPDWVINAQRTSWKVKTAPATPKGEKRGQWTGGDIEYTYFKGGDVVARFREGGLYGTLTTDPVPEFEKDPEPETPPAA